MNKNLNVHVTDYDTKQPIAAAGVSATYSNTVSGHFSNKCHASDAALTDATGTAKLVLADNNCPYFFEAAEKFFMVEVAAPNYSSTSAEPGWGTVEVLLKKGPEGNGLSYSHVLDQVASKLSRQGDISFVNGDCKNAINKYASAINISPDSLGPYLHLSWLLSTCSEQSARDGQRSVELVEKVIDNQKCKSVSSQDTRALACAATYKVLAAAYAESGSYSDAVNYQSRAISLLGDYPALRNEYMKYLESYNNNHPWRTNKLFVAD